MECFTSLSMVQNEDLEKIKHETLDAYNFGLLQLSSVLGRWHKCSSFAAPIHIMFNRLWYQRLEITSCWNLRIHTFTSIGKTFAIVQIIFIPSRQCNRITAIYTTMNATYSWSKKTKVHMPYNFQKFMIAIIAVWLRLRKFRHSSEDIINSQTWLVSWM